MLPPEQKWAFLAVFLHTSDMFVRPPYRFIYPAIFISWYFPVVPTAALVSTLVSVDGFRRQGQNAMNNSISRVFDIMTAFFFFGSESGWETPALASLAGSFFGAPEHYSYVLFPLLPGLLLRSRRESINGFIPEGRKQGTIFALFSRAVIAFLPRTIQWAPFGILAFPDPQNTHMTVEFLGCYIVWVFLDVHPQVAYTAYLFVNQWTYWTIQNKHRGAIPSSILSKERTGTIWFALMCLVIRAVEFEFGPEMLANGTMDLGVRVWLPLLTVLFLGIYLLRYGLGIRLHKFEHLPIREQDGVRLLRLRPQPKFRDSPIQCDMVHARLSAPPPYTAISHRWMDPGDGQGIILIDEAPFLVSPSIHSLLIAKRSYHKHAYPWIDSICIS
ncbi:hypothetical protein OQA88_10989 [Cercophora sp. LCS_1]